MPSTTNSSKKNTIISHNKQIKIIHNKHRYAEYHSWILTIMCLLLTITNALTAPTIENENTLLTSLMSSTSSSSTSSLSSSLSKSTKLHTFLQNPGSNSRLRKRHSKRHSFGYDHNDLNENSTILEWVNPCGGFYDPTAEVTKQSRRKNPRKIYNTLKSAAGQEFKNLNNSQQYIDISNFEWWSKYEFAYKFLPKLKKNSSIALKRWYRNIQTYVASFAYLRRIQLKYDRTKSQIESDNAHELKILLMSSRSILCELEVAINKTHPYQHRQRQLPQVSREQMNKRLKMRTRKKAIVNPHDLQEADSIDLIFVKYYYYEFLENMWNVLRKLTKRKGQAALRINFQQQFNEVEKNFPTSSTSVKSKRKLNHNNRNSSKSST